MLYQLPNGKTIEISIDQYLKLSDEELNSYISYNIGEEINDPFAHSVLREGFKEEDFEELDDYSDEQIKDLLDIPSTEKLFDEDFTLDNLET